MLYRAALVLIIIPTLRFPKSVSITTTLYLAADTAWNGSLSQSWECYHDPSLFPIITIILSFILFGVQFGSTVTVASGWLMQFPAVAVLSWIAAQLFIEYAKTSCELLFGHRKEYEKTSCE